MIKIIKNFNNRPVMRHSNGFSLVELLVSVSIFLIFVIAINGTMGTVNKATKNSANRERATVLAEEALEATRNIRDSGNGFLNLPDGTYGLSTSGNIFSLSGSSDVSGIFTRVINISSISGSQKKVTSTISWADQTNPINSIVLNTYFTDWRAPLNIGLTISKVVVGGIKVPSDFLPTILSTSQIDNSQEPPVSVNVDIPIIFSPSTMTLSSGVYTFLTSSDPDYTPSVSSGCTGNSIVLSNGDAKICTITYTANSIPCIGTPWGTMPDGTSNTGYLVSSVTYPSTCISEVRTCTAGILSGTYTNTSCSVTFVAPTVTTASPITSITENTAHGTGTVVSDGGATVSVSGLVWSTTINPTTALSTKTTDGWAIGGPWTGTQDMTGLTCNTLYHVRAYATNSVGTSYGSDATFTTSACAVIPTVTNPTVTSIGTATATLGATVTSLGLPASISARGTCLGTTPAPTTNCLAEGGTITGIFTQARTGLIAGTLYYYRGYATNSTGMAYSTDGTFTTSAVCTSALVGTPTVYDNASSVSAIVTKPTGVTTGDIMFAEIMHFNGTDRLTIIPTGWLPFDSATGRHKNGNYNQALYYKVATATEGANYTFGLSSSAKLAVTISAYRGCFNTTTPIDTSSNVQYVASNTTYRAVSMTLPSPYTNVIMFPSFYTTTVRTFTAPTTQAGGWTTDYNNGATTSSFSRAVFHKMITTSGVTDVIDSIGWTGTTGKHAFAVALHPL